MKIKHIILLLLIPLSEIKAIFYDSDLRVSWYLFSDNERYMCNVLESYSNIIVIGVVFYYYRFLKPDIITKQIVLFLFVVNFYDFVFLGLMDSNHYLWKIPLSIITYQYANIQIHIQRT